MTQADRDRLVTLKKAKKKLITQREAAEELGVSIRHVKRLLRALKKRGDKAVIHGLRGKPSNRRIPEATEKEAVKTLSAEVYEDFGPTLASEYLGKKHGIHASKETVRQWMIRGKLWRAKAEKVTRFTSGDRGAAVLGNWCSGTPVSTTGWKGAERIST